MIKMPSLERPDFAALGLVALNLALAAAVLSVIFWPAKEETGGIASASAPSAATRAIPANFSASQSPLFGRSHIVLAPQPSKPMQPAANGAPAPSASEARPLQWRVTGIIIAEGAAPIALVERKGQATETRRVTVGAELEDWRVEQIASRSVSFRRGVASVVVALDPTP